MGEEKIEVLILRNVRAEHLDKLFGGPVISVHDIGDGCVVVETAESAFGMTQTETALLRALIDLDVQRHKDIIRTAQTYVELLAVRGETIRCTASDISYSLVKIAALQKSVKRLNKEKKARANGQAKSR